MSDDDGVLRSSESLADAVRAEHALRPPAGKGLSAPADLHIKTAAAGDIDNDGDLDLWVESTGGKNVVSHFMVNDGAGEFQIERDRATDAVFRNKPPDYWRHVGNGFVDVDNDGDLDLALGQIQDDDGEAFVDETSTWMGDQSLATAERYPNGGPLHNAASPTMLDIDRDGCEDIVMAKANTLIRSESPLLYLNNGSGQFRPVDPSEMFTGMDWSGIYGVPADVNGDGVIDLVFPQRIVGPDDEYGTDDDSTRFLTLLNTTPPRPVRCEP